MTIKKNIKLNSPVQVVQKFLFLTYNLSYVAYSQGIISNSIQFFFLFSFIFFNMLIAVTKRKNFKDFFWKYPFKQALLIFSIITIISIIAQIYHSDYQNYLINSLTSFITPIFLAFFFVNSIGEKDELFYFNVFLVRIILIFLFENADYLNFRNILSISWTNSFSPFESSMAHEFFLIECIYLFKNKRSLAFISMFFCMLSMKRLSFILAPIIYVFYKLIDQREEQFIFKKNVEYFLKLLGLVSPFILMFLYSENTYKFLLNSLGFDLNNFMSGRRQIYEIMINNIPYFNGFGSINSWLSQFSFNFFGTTWNGILHNDVLRFYFEFTFLGYFIFIICFINIFKANIWTIVMGTYLLFALITSHMLDYFPVWIIYYLGCATIYRKRENIT